MNKMESIILSILLITACTVVMLYDAFATYSGVPTVSAQMQSWAREWPILPFLFGILAGHLFWPQQR